MPHLGKMRNGGGRFQLLAILIVGICFTVGGQLLAAKRPARPVLKSPPPYSAIQELGRGWTLDFTNLSSGNNWSTAIDRIYSEAVKAGAFRLNFMKEIVCENVSVHEKGRPSVNGTTTVTKGKGGFAAQQVMAALPRLPGLSGNINLRLRRITIAGRDGWRLMADEGTILNLLPEVQLQGNVLVEASGRRLTTAKLRWSAADGRFMTKSGYRLVESDGRCMVGERAILTSELERVL